MATATGAITLPVAASRAVPQAAARETRGGRRRLLIAAAGAAVLLALTLGGLRLAGAEWFSVTTPSMGTAVPVGALAVDAPTAASALAVGDVITFTPPGAHQAVHTHRIVAIGPRGVRTRGDANSSDDPWTLTSGAIRGRVVAVLPGLGWLMRVLPLLLVGGLVTWGAALLLRRPDLRAAAVLLGASLSVSAACLVFRPLVNAVLLTATAGTRGAVATVVSTGLLPVRVSAGPRSHVDLVNGQVGVLHVGGGAGRIDLAVALHLPPLGWAVVAAICVLPLAVPVLSAVVGRRR